MTFHAEYIIAEPEVPEGAIHMLGPFLKNPLWHSFQKRSLWVVSLSEPEHRLRDARALIRLQAFLPPTESGQCTFATVTVDAESPPRWPTIPTDAGIVIVGRPSLFGSEATRLLTQSSPPILFCFKSDNPSETTDYRAIGRRGAGEDDYRCLPFYQQRERSAETKELMDYGIVFCGWSDGRPIMLLAGTSTVGTWGAVQYATEYPLGDDIRWHTEVQGVVQASVTDNREAFEAVNVEALEMLAPVHVWLSGADLPPKTEWGNRKTLRLQRPRKGQSVDLRMLVNGKEIMRKATTHIPALVFLAWLGSERQRAFHDGFIVKKTAGEVAQTLYKLLRIEESPLDLGQKSIRSWADFQAHFSPHIVGTLRELVTQVRLAGGIAFAEERVSEDDTARIAFSICARNLPHFLPHIA